MMTLKTNYYWLLILFPLIFLAWFFISKQKDKPARYLPYFGPKNAVKINDTSYHSVPDFHFTDQNNHKVDQNAVKGKIYVTEFFFTTCQSICPIMNSNLERIYSKFKSDPEFLILSHTVDPEEDSVEVLKRYADSHGVNDDKWLFVTGTKPDLYGIARKGYLLDANEGDGGAEAFIHTQNFALVDKERHIRGYYDGTDSLEVERLIREIILLKKEYEFKSKTD
jgi:protein SCO1